MAPAIRSELAEALRLLHFTVPDIPKVTHFQVLQRNVTGHPRGPAALRKMSGLDAKCLRRARKLKFSDSNRNELVQRIAALERLVQRMDAFETKFAATSVDSAKGDAIEVPGKQPCSDDERDSQAATAFSPEWPLELQDASLQADSLASAAAEAVDDELVGE